MVLLQGVGSCPTHSTAYQPLTQLSMKEAGKDRGFIGKEKIEMGPKDVEGDRDMFLIGRKSAAALLKKRGRKQRRGSTQGLHGQKPDSESVDGCRGHALLVYLSFSFLVSSSPPVSLTIAFPVDSWAFFSLLSLLCSLFFSTIRLLTGGLGP